ncbi:MAG: type II secretion system F family protein [Phycisphaerales bacterium]|nr:type II secretion system F family protein [Phycisphaerales bacterium]
MTAFNYTALSTDGKTISGSVPADSRAAAIAAVVAKGLSPIKVEEQGSGKKNAVKPFALSLSLGKNGSNAASKPGRVTQRHVEAFTRELASLLAGGVPLARALHLLRRESKASGPQALWSQIHDDVVGGTALADALAQHPRQFSTVYVAMVRAGEAGGFLDIVLNQIAEFRTREQDLKGKVKAALVYPCVLAFMAVGVVGFLMIFFIPTFKGIFSDFGANLPFLTQIILNASNTMTSRSGLVVLGLTAAIVFGIYRYISTDAGKRKMEQFILKVPGLGNVVAFFAMVRFCRMLGTLLGAGVPLVASLKVAKEAIGNQTLADTVAHGIEEVQRGESLARALGSSEKLFPATVVEMIAIAEETGRLDKELVRLSISYESELDRKLRMLVALAEPLLLFIMASIIGTIVIGMLLPIFKLQELIK